MTTESGGQKPSKYIRYRYQGRDCYGILDGETVREIRGGLFGDCAETGASMALNSVQPLWPCEPSKIMAVGLNYRSHIPDRPIPKNPEFFFVPTSALLEPEGKIVLPADARQVHYEGELVIVIGRVTRRVTATEANECIFGFTCGHDVSERGWQKNDLQWWRAKGCDTFSPMGPVICQRLRLAPGPRRNPRQRDSCPVGSFYRVDLRSACSGEFREPVSDASARGRDLHGHARQHQ